MANYAIHAGGCLCGAVRFTVNGPMRDVMYCHCEQCRRTSGHYVAATACSKDDLVIESDNDLSWFESSDHARRGFCGRCGSSLFWDAQGRGTMSIMAGSLDVPTGLRATGHIFIESASDYYTLNDGLPKFPRCETGDEQSTEREYR